MVQQQFGYWTVMTSLPLSVRKGIYRTYSVFVDMLYMRSLAAIWTGVLLLISIILYNAVLD